MTTAKPTTANYGISHRRQTGLLTKRHANDGRPKAVNWWWMQIVALPHPRRHRARRVADDVKMTLPAADVIIPRSMTSNCDITRWWRRTPVARCFRRGRRLRRGRWCFYSTTDVRRPNPVQQSRSFFTTLLFHWLPILLGSFSLIRYGFVTKKNVLHQ